MTKTELINVVAEKTGFSKKDSDKAVVAVIDAISEALAGDVYKRQFLFASAAAYPRQEQTQHPFQSYRTR